MRAERFRGSRIRSPSSPNKTDRKRQSSKSPAHAGLFLFGLHRTAVGRRRNAGASVILLALCGSRSYELRQRASCVDAKPMLGHALQIATATARARRKTFQGYPLPTIKKKRACLVTYRHSGDSLLENVISATLNRKQIMNLFYAIVRNVTALPGFESVRRFKTLPLAAKHSGLICACEVVFGGPFDESFSLREIGHAVSLRAFAAPTALQTSAV